MRRIALSVFAIVLIAGAARAQTVVDQIIARVNDKIILSSEYNEGLLLVETELAQQFQGEQLQTALVEIRRDLMRNMIDEQLIISKAEELGISSDLEVIKTMERLRQENNFETLEALELAILQQGTGLDEFKEGIRSQYFRNQVLQREVYNKIIISVEDLRNYYRANIDSFDRPAGVRLLEIALITEGREPEEVEAARARAEEALERIRSGEDYSNVAAEVSESPSAASGGELGFFESGMLLEDYALAVEGLGRNQVSEILELPGELAILKVADRHEGGILSFELARNEIQDLLWLDRVTPRIRVYLSQLRSDGFVEIQEGYTDTGADDADEGP